MANDLNAVNLVARLTRDPELRSLPSGQSVCEMRVAFNTSQKQGNEFVDVGNFINVTVWGAQGETVARLLAKGSRVAIGGRLSHRTYEDKEGNTREVHSIIAHQVQFLDPKSDAPRVASVSTPASQPAMSTPDEDCPF